jgi:hypothetical protein
LGLDKQVGTPQHFFLGKVVCWPEFVDSIHDVKVHGSLSIQTTSFLPSFLKLGTRLSAVDVRAGAGNEYQ